MTESLGTANNEHSYSFQMMEPFWRSEWKGGSWQLKRKIQYCSHIWETKCSSRTEGWRCQNCLPATMALEKGSKRCDSENRQVWVYAKLLHIMSAITRNESTWNPQRNVTCSAKPYVFSVIIILDYTCVTYYDPKFKKVSMIESTKSWIHKRNFEKYFNSVTSLCYDRSIGPSKAISSHSAI